MKIPPTKLSRCFILVSFQITGHYQRVDAWTITQYNEARIRPCPRISHIRNRKGHSYLKCTLVS
jgi:hypothetical protein